MSTSAHNIMDETIANFKLLIIGDSGVGKSSLLLRYVSDSFESKLAATIGVDFKVKLITVPDGTVVKLSIWDTAGQERFRTLTPSVYRGSHGAIFVFSVANRDTFDQLDSWLEELKTYADQPNIVKLLVGNKIDCEPREVSREEGQRFARLYNMPYAEASAKTSEGVNLLFMEVVTRIYNQPQLWKHAHQNNLSYDERRLRLNKPSFSTEGRSNCCT